jgi:hypothetical protein
VDEGVHQKDEDANGGDKAKNQREHDDYIRSMALTASAARANPAMPSKR